LNRATNRVAGYLNDPQKKSLSGETATSAGVYSGRREHVGDRIWRGFNESRSGYLAYGGEISPEQSDQFGEITVDIHETGEWQAILVRANFDKLLAHQRNFYALRALRTFRHTDYWQSFYKVFLDSALEHTGDVTESLVERDLQLIQAGEEQSASKTSLPTRLSYESVRRNSRALILFVALTQAIYLFTDIQLIHPFLAALLTIAGFGFYWMAIEMRKEIREALASRRSKEDKGETRQGPALHSLAR
jgi:hypothetical protein